MIGPSFVKFDPRATNRLYTSVDLCDIAHIFNVKDNPDLIFFTFKDSYRSHLYSVKNAEHFKDALMEELANTFKYAESLLLPPLPSKALLTVPSNFH